MRLSAVPSFVLSHHSHRAAEHKMFLLRVAASLASSVFFSSFALAQVYATNCTSDTWQWTYNSLGQSPCTVTAYMMATCDGGLKYFNCSHVRASWSYLSAEYTLPALLPGFIYRGANEIAAADLCLCNTVGYSLFSACGACQAEEWMPWSEWITNCTKPLPPSSFPNPIPSEIRVPQWALLDVTNENNWNPNKSYAVGDSPEPVPGSILGPSSASVIPSATSSASSSGTPMSATTPSSSSGGSGSNMTAIIAGSVAGIIITIFVVIPSILVCLRRRSQAAPAVSAGVSATQPHVDDIPRPPPDEMTSAPSSLPGRPITMRFYDPKDPTTFPGHQGDPHSQETYSQVPMSLYIASGTTLVNTQTSLHRARGYHGLPIV
ncbi:hypothetical protein BJV77DRAFT_453168 [Russula vinacea]|nr:hypothetical protein BJV77DRAFT_453168 [Russula vinacea]